MLRLQGKDMTKPCFTEIRDILGIPMLWIMGERDSVSGRWRWRGEECRHRKHQRHGFRDGDGEDSRHTQTTHGSSRDFRKPNGERCSRLELKYELVVVAVVVEGVRDGS